MRALIEVWKGLLKLQVVAAFGAAHWSGERTPARMGPCGCFEGWTGGTPKRPTAKGAVKLSIGRAGIERR